MSWVVGVLGENCFKENCCCAVNPYYHPKWERGRFLPLFLNACERDFNRTQENLIRVPYSKGNIAGWCLPSDQEIFSTRAKSPKQPGSLRVWLMHCDHRMLLGFVSMWPRGLRKSESLWVESLRPCLVGPPKGANRLPWRTRYKWTTRLLHVWGGHSQLLE